MCETCEVIAPPERDERSKTDRTDQPLLVAGDVVGGRYVLSQLVGRGAAGTVWEAEHRLLTSRVAIKFLDTAALLDPTSADILAQRFRFEAQISARLAANTKHIVSAHDAGMFRGIPYLVMEMVNGETLDARLMRGPLSLSAAAELLDQLAEPIDSAHSFGIAHRDIKPANIMVVPLTSGPFYKLGDFGTAKAFGEGLVGLTPPKQTSENTLVGSPAYMSPEYISGLPLVTGSIDLWALAVTMYETLTGKLPFDGEVWTQVAVAIVGGEFTPPSQVVDGLTPAIDDIFRRAFAQDVEQRFASASHFANVFRTAVNQPVVQETSEPHVTSRPEPLTPALRASLLPPPPLEEHERSSPRRIWGFAALGLLFVGGLGLVARLIGGDDPPQTTASGAKTSAAVTAIASVPSARSPTIPSPERSVSIASVTASTLPTTSSARHSASSAASASAPSSAPIVRVPPPPTMATTPPPSASVTSAKTKPSSDPSEIH